MSVCLLNVCVCASVQLAEHKSVQELPAEVVARLEAQDTQRALEQQQQQAKDNDKAMDDKAVGIVAEVTDDATIAVDAAATTATTTTTTIAAATETVSVTATAPVDAVRGRHIPLYGIGEFDRDVMQSLLRVRAPRRAKQPL